MAFRDTKLALPRKLILCRNVLVYTYREEDFCMFHACENNAVCLNNRRLCFHNLHGEHIPSLNIPYYQAVPCALRLIPDVPYLKCLKNYPGVVAVVSSC